MYSKMKFFSATTACAAIFGCASAFAVFDEGSDLSFFLSAPNIRAPKFNISYQDLDKVSPGFWLLAPYDTTRQDGTTTKLEPCQVGPVIYDNQGQLVWTGACDFQNGNVFNFDAFQRDGKSHLNMLLRSRRVPLNGKLVYEERGLGVVLDETYRATDVVHTRHEDREYNMHEFLVTPDDSAIILLGVPMETDLTPPLGADGEKVWAWAGGFREVEISSGRVLFDWQMLDHMTLNESTVPVRQNTSSRVGWDWFHPNSVDKFSNGDYLLSGRYSDAIYKISKEDKSIVWRLGGWNSSFQQDGFNFSRQHDARVVSQSGSKTRITFLDNGSDGINSTAVTTSGLEVELDEAEMTARVVTRWLRPDGDLSKLRGNVQKLPNGNVYICWSENGYISEFSPEGTLLLEAKWTSKRLTAYRSFKRPFVGRPTYPPKLASYAYGDNPMSSVTTIYVSWNGATEVSSWTFYGMSSVDQEPKKLGNVPRTGFETRFSFPSFQSWVYVEAIAADGSTLGSTARNKTAIPYSWGNNQGSGDHVEDAFLDGWHYAELDQIDAAPTMFDSHFEGAVAHFSSSTLISLVAGLILGAATTLCTMHFTGRVRRIPYRSKSSANGGAYQLVGMNGHEPD